MTDLPTVDISGVEILRQGRWNGREYTTEEFDQMILAFNELKGIYDPPSKLGHNKEQSLLTSDGLPSAGWISHLTRVGDRLIADFTKVPQKVASLIKAGGYRKRSAEVWFGVNLNGKKYPAVLKAVAWLGADPPAVSSLNDVVAMYSDEDDREVTVATMTVKSEDLIEKKSEDLIEKKSEELAANSCPDCGMDCDECPAGCPCHKKSEQMAEKTAPAKKSAAPSFSKFVNDFSRMTRNLDKLFSGAGAELGLTEDESKEFADGMALLSTFITSQSSTTNKSKEDPMTATLSDDQIRQIFEIKPEEDLLTALISRKATAVNLSDYETLSSQVETLTQTAREREVDEIVHKALRIGKLAPKQVEWAKEYCLSDPSGFSTYLESAVKVADFKELGSSEDLSTKELTDQELLIAKNLGNDPEKVRDIKQRQLA